MINLFSIAMLLMFAFAIPSHGYADDKPSDESADAAELKLKTERVVVFKDGYCLVVKQATGTTDEKGIVFTDDVPDAATLGSFWAVAENATIKSTIAGWVDTEEETDREVSCTNIIEIVKSNLGKRCSFQFEDETIEGTLQKILANEKDSTADSTADTTVASSPFGGSPSQLALLSSQLPVGPTVAVEVSAVSGEYFIVRTDTGDKMVSAKSVKNLTIKDMKSSIEQRVTTKSRHKRLSMKFAEANTKVKINLMYFRPDVRWIPTYRINLTDELVAKADGEGESEKLKAQQGSDQKGGVQEAPRKRAGLILQGEILNEAEDFTDVPFHVVVGVPNFRFRDVPSPMVLEGTMRNILSQAAPAILGNRSNGFSNALYNQAGAFHSNRAAGGDQRSGIEFPQELAGKAGNDLYVYQLPPMTLKRGERATVPILRTEVEYRDIYTWDIEVTHAETQAATSADSSPLTLNKSKVWRQVELINNSDIPWTTGAAMMVDDVQPLAQELLTYTSPGGICRIPVTVSIDLRGEVNDTEVNRVYNALKWRGRNFARVEGEIKTELANSKTVAVPVEVSLRFGGKATKVSDDGKITLEGYRPEDWRNNEGNAINNSSTVRWTANIEPGECFKPVINYEFLLYH